MNSLKIDITQQLGGLNFSLSPKTRQNILKEFPEARPLKKIFVSFDSKYALEGYSKYAFEGYSRKIEEYITPALVGITKEELDKIPEIVYANAVSEEAFYRIKHAA